MLSLWPSNIFRAFRMRALVPIRRNMIWIRRGKLFKWSYICHEIEWLGYLLAAKPVNWVEKTVGFPLFSCKDSNVILCAEEGHTPKWAWRHAKRMQGNKYLLAEQKSTIAQSTLAAVNCWVCTPLDSFKSLLETLHVGMSACHSEKSERP